MQRVFDIAALAFVLLLLGSHVAWIAEPWDDSLGGVNGGAYYGYACKGLEAHGFFAKRMQGPEFFHKEDAAIWRPYTNHPGTGYFLIYPCYKYLGRNEAALRVAPLLGCILLFLLFRFSLARVLSPVTASTATMVLAALPLLYQYGNMVDIPIFCLMLATPTLVAWRGWRESRHGYLIYFAFAFASGMMDWFAYFLVPGMWLIDLFEAGNLKERLRRAFLIGLPFGIALILVGTWLIWAEGGLPAFKAHVEQLMMAFNGELMANQSEVQRTLAGDSPPFFPSIGRHLWRTITLPVVILAGLGLLRGIAARLRAPVAKIALAGLIAGVLPTFAFQTHAAKHEFWFMMASAPLALLVAGAFLGFDREIRARRGLQMATLGFIVALSGFLAMKGIALHDSYRTTGLRERGLAMAQKFGPRDFVMTSIGLAADRFYCDAVTVPGVRSRAAYDEIRDKLRDYPSSFDRVFVIWALAETADYKWLSDLPLVTKDVKASKLGPVDVAILEIDPTVFFAN